MTAATVAFISDIHGNAPALEAVLADAGARGAERCYNLGDSVGDVPFPNETIDLLRRRGVASIVGNFDRNITEYERRLRRLHVGRHPARVAAIHHTRAAITTENLEYLRGLPGRLEVEVEGVRFLLVHGSPRKEGESIFPSTAEERLAEMAAGVEADAIAFGHTHRPFVRRAAGKLWLNAGSVGRPLPGPRASYVVARCAAGTVAAEVVWVEYPVQAALDAIDRSGLPPALKTVLLKGRWPR